MRRTGNGLKLDLTENTPGSSSGVSRLPNLVEHAEICHQATSAVRGENLSSKLPNVVEGSMDYGNERRSSRYMEYEPKTNFQDGQTVSNSYGTGGEVTFANDGRPTYSSRSFDRKTPVATNYDRDNLDRYDNSRIYPEEGHLRYERRTERSYQESDLDAPYDRTEATKLRGYTQDIQEGGRRYSRDLTDYEYAARYAEETLKLEPKKSDSLHQHHGNSKIYEPVIAAKGYDTLASKGYESGIKTRDSSYELGSFSNQPQQQQDIGGRKYESKYHSVGKMYGTLPRYESSTSKAYDSNYDSTGGGRSFDPKYEDSSYEVGMKGSSTSKYDLTTSKSYERSKYEPVSRYQEPPTSKSYEQTLKIGEMSTTGGSQQQGSSAYPRKQNQEARDSAAAAAGSSEKTNGYRKNNFEAFGVYSDPEDDHGFLADKKAPQYTYKGVVVNVSGESSVVDQKRAKEARQTEVPRSPWCRPTILLLLLVLLVVIFVFVAGILLYFNYMSYKPRHPVVEGKDLNFASNNAVGAASAEHFQAWKTNTEYQYEIRGRTMSGLHDFSNQYTGIILRALLTVQPKSRDTLQAKISNAQYAQIHTKLRNGWDSELSDDMLDLKELPISDKVFEIKMKRGVVINLIVDKNMPTWEINVLKSIVSQLQVDTQTTNAIQSRSNQEQERNRDSSTYKIMEDSIGGKCEVLYNITSLSESILHTRPELVLNSRLRGDGEVIEILKTRDYCNCEQQVVYRFGNTESNNWGPCMDDNGKFLSRSSVGRIVVTGNVKTFTIQSSVGTQQVILSPNLNENKKGMVSSRVNMTLIKMGPISSSSWLIPAYTVAAGNLVYTYTNDDYRDSSSSNNKNSAESIEEQLNETPSTPFFVGYPGKSILNFGEVPVITSKTLAYEIGRDLENPNSIPDEQTLEKFTILSKIIRTMNTRQIAEVEQQYYQPVVSNYGRDNSENVRSSAWLAFRDAVAQAGTGPALMTIKNWIKAKKLNGLEAASVVGVLSKTARTPTSEYIDAFFQMVTMPEITHDEYLNSTAMITFAELIRFSQLRNDSSIRDYIPYMSKQLEQSIENDELAKSHVFIHALGTLADPRIVTIFEPYLDGKILASTFQKLLMVFSMNKLASVNPEMARETFYKIYQNIEEDTQLRCAAVAFLMSTNPPASMLQSMAVSTNYDNNTLVNAIVKSSIESASKLEALESQDFATNAQNVLPLLKKDPNGYKNYMNYLSDHPEYDLNLVYRMHAYTASDANINLALYTSLQEAYNKLQLPKYEIGEIISSVKDLYTALSKPFKSHNKETWKKNDNILFTPENIAKLLKIESKDNKKFEGAIWMNSKYTNQFVSMDRHTLPRITKLLGYPEIASLKEGQNFNIAEMNSYELSLSFPMEFGFPFQYIMEVPSMLKYSGSAKGEIAPDFVKGSIDVRVVYSMQIQARLGFITPFDNQYYMAGVNKNLQMHAPVRAEFTYKTSENSFILKLQPIEQNEKNTVAHYSVVPFTSRYDILNLYPVINNEESLKLINHNVSHRSCGEKNLKYYTEFDSDGGYKNNSNWDTFARGMFTLDKDNHVYDRIDVYWDPDQSSEHAVIFSSSLDTLHNDMYYDESTSKVSPKATAPTIKSKKLNDPERRKELMKEAAKGIAVADAFALDIGIEIIGNESSQYFMGIAYANSKVDPKSRGLAYWRVTEPQCQMEFETCAGFESRSMRSSVFAADVNFRDFDVDLHVGPTCENATYKFKVHGEQQRTKRYNDILYAHPIMLECMEEVNRGAASMPACQDSSVKTCNLDETHVTVKFDSKKPGFREGFLQTLGLFANIASNGKASVTGRTGSDTPIDNNVLEFYMYLDPSNYTANFSYESTELRFTAQDVEMPLGALIFNAHPDLSVRELVEMKLNDADSHQRMCVFDTNWASTFDRATYPIDLGKCWHVAMTTYPKINEDTRITEDIDEDMNLSVLVRDAGDYIVDTEDIYNVKKDVQIVLGSNQLIFTTIDSKIHVTVNGKTVNLPGIHRYRHISDEDVDFELHQRPDDSVRLSSSKYGVVAFYDGQRIQIKTIEKYHSDIRGLCGNYDGNAANDFTSPKGCVLLKSADFIGSYALTSSDCQGPALENSKKAKDAVCNQPCEKTYCAWGATCVISESGRADCKCPVDCPSSPEPVCGSDDVTYTNHCQLRQASCQKRKTTRVKHQGACELKDPCNKLNCSQGSQCVRSRDGTEAKCECLETCPSLGDHEGSGPVCGTDGIDYPTVCDLNRSVCARGVNVTVAFRGKCDPCGSVECLEPEVCQLDLSRQPACRCGEQCGLEFSPVCGSDGKTYSNECSLRQEACRSRLPLRKIYTGACSSGTNPCDDAQCSVVQQCAIDRYGIAMCECGPECEPVMRPVCARGGTTYTSLCELKRHACMTKTTIDLAYAGNCGSRGPCSEKICQWGAICAENGDTATCKCPTCSVEFHPVCGDDGISYGNECKLRLEACQHHREIHVRYQGLCNGCGNKKCEHYGKCESDSSGEANCVCPNECEEPTKDNEADTKVCGTDGVTYISECAMKKSSCASQTHIAVNYRGDCELCANVECEHGSRCVAGNCICPESCPENTGEMVCGSDAKTYRSECELQRAACERDSKLPALQVIFYGECGEKFAVAALTTMSTPTITRLPTTIAEVTSTQEREACKDIHCDFEATCELGPDKFPRCSCKFDCASVLPENATPVCGSDLKTYPSICAMKMEACQRQQELRLRPLDLCQGMKVKPCNGDVPVTDADGKEYDCGSGADRRDCPSNTYCHQTALFARCCKKVQGIQVVKCFAAWHGCCPDGKTAALGADGAGCPSVCNCNRLGSVSDTCNPETGQCECKRGVGGVRCDRCMPGYWGLPKISEAHPGCIPCGCSLYGSVREDCEQMTGRCVCKPNVVGIKCTLCKDHNKILAPTGCYSADTSPSIPTSCNNLECYSGGQCSELGDLHCDCPSACPADLPSMPVCGSDTQTYDNECELRLYACRHQADVVTQAFGHCRDNPMVNTDFPVKRYTAVQYTQPAAAISPLSKSTRHLLGPEPDPRYYYTHRAQQETITIDRDNLKHGVAAASRPTPATIRVVTALLGDLCTDDKDCTIPNSECINGGCICSDGFAETSDRQECFANYDSVTPVEALQACLSYPCHMSSTCIDLPSSTFVCICRPNYTGLLCDEEIDKRDYEVPSFDGKSYVRMARLKAYNKFNIEVEFKTYADNGIILYNQQKNDGTGDFVSIAIIDGYVQFRYNLGNGPVILRSPEKVSMKNFHRIVAKRYHKDGVLIFNNGDNIAGQSQGMLKFLDLNQDTFVGNVPTNYSRVYENIGTRRGLLGCIRKLKIDRATVDLHIGKDKDVLETYRVKECLENACANLPCQNGATCQPIFEEDLCNGRECRNSPKKGKGKRKNNNNNNSNKNGGMNIVRCKGSHCTAVESKQKRSKKRNGTKSSKKRCAGPSCDFDYDMDYEANYDNINYALAKYEPPDYRCICTPQYTGKNCEESLDPCMGEPCQHGGTCDILPQSGYVCKCPPGRAGEHCEILDSELTELLIPELTGDGFLELPCLEGVAKAFSIELWFLTRSTDGLLLYNGQLNNGRGDFISLNLVRGKLEFRFNLGSGIANITSPDLVTLDTWHCVRISRLNREGLLQLDDGTVARGFSGNPLTELNLEMPLYVGGVKHWREVHRLAEAWTGLVGAVQRLMVNGKTYQNLAVNVTQHNTEIYDGLPCPSNENPCHNGGVCLPLLNSYLCKCASSYNGLHCEFFMGYDVSGGEISERPVRFDGDNFLQFKHRYGRSANTTLATNNTTPAEYSDETYPDYDVEEDVDFEYENYDYAERRGQESNKFELRIRTTHSEGLIAWIGRGKIEHLVLSLHEGHVMLTYKSKNEQKKTLQSREKIDDGVFHHVKAFRRRRATIIQIDDQAPVKIITDTTLLMTNGKLFIGGKPGHRGIKGCVTDFIVDKRRLPLTRRKIDFCHDNDV